MTQRAGRRRTRSPTFRSAPGSVTLIQLTGDGAIALVVDGATSTFTMPAAFDGYGEYFKAGDYDQTAGTDATVGATVKLYALAVSHEPAGWNPPNHSAGVRKCFCYYDGDPVVGASKPPAFPDSSMKKAASRTNG